MWTHVPYAGTVTFFDSDECHDSSYLFTTTVPHIVFTANTASGSFILPEARPVRSFIVEDAAMWPAVYHARSCFLTRKTPSGYFTELAKSKNSSEFNSSDSTVGSATDEEVLSDNWFDPLPEEEAASDSGNTDADLGPQPKA
ncbi:hypothetical protein BBJ28_00021024 [Nothophytophthora sp. Chile5]|nr:hypothetical protein BBJ28_00021024 [Nothophytophthora sp. Chile5]